MGKSMPRCWVHDPCDLLSMMHGLAMDRETIDRYKTKREIDQGEDLEMPWMVDSN